MDELLQSYLVTHTKERKGLFLKMEQFAKEQRVPIMDVVSIELLLQLVRIQQPQRILEIGTAIGYSALRMAEACPNAHIVTIERDEDRHQLAEDFIKESQKQNQITLLKGDALELAQQVANFGLFDFIFIDAAKGQYANFFNIYEKHLNKNGVIVTDNVLFRGLVYNETVVSRRHRKMVKKLKAFTKQLIEHPNYDTTIVPVGDGVAISRKRGG